MSTIAPIQSALYGLRTQLDRFERTAEQIAAEAPSGRLAEQMVDLSISKAGVQANVKVVQTADEMLGSLLDLLG